MSLSVVTAEFLKSAAEPKDFPEESSPEIALAGRSNVGKSSAINALTLRKKLAVTSSMPGRTRLVNFFDITLRGKSGQTTFPIRLVDLPGYGFAQASKNEREDWRGRVEGYLVDRAALRAVVHLVDIRHEPSDLDRDLSEWLASLEIPEILVLTKSDKLSRNERFTQATRMEKALGLEARSSIVFSALEGLGRDDLWLRIARSV